MSARHPSRAGTGWALLTAAVAAVASAFALSCGEEHHPGLVGGIDPSRPGIGDSCATAAEARGKGVASALISTVNAPRRRAS